MIWCAMTISSSLEEREKSGSGLDWNRMGLPLSVPLRDNWLRKTVNPISELE